MPAMARRQRRTDRLEPVFLNGVELVALAALPASLLIAVSAPEIVRDCPRKPVGTTRYPC